MIEESWQRYHDLHRAEAENGFEDALEGFERCEAEGYALGLSAAYNLFYNEIIEDNSPNMFDPYEDIPY